MLLAIAARGGSRPKLSVSSLFKPVGRLLLAMAASAVAFGTIGYLLARHGTISPPFDVASELPPSRYARFMADWWAHGASYAVGFIGGIVVCVMQYRKRIARP